VDALGAHGQVEVLAVSSVYSTAPVGGPEQDDYLNAVVLVDTELSPHELLALAQRIEADHHRTREVRWGPRTLDVDLIALQDAGGEVLMDTADLTLPHPRAFERAFVCVPWTDVEPERALPDLDASDVHRIEEELVIR
jgi:2-amino-4-hydroxy-6-hydroxymethyldihydropteridine diphosphokinase